MALSRVALLAAALGWAGMAAAETPQPSPPASPPPAVAPKADPAGKATDGPDTWIFSGALQGSGETFSATLVADKMQAQFEMKLGSGATCDGGQMKGDVGLVRLPEITCSDERAMRALFVPQGGNILKVFGHVGDQRFVAEAHLLGSEAPPEPKQTAQPKGPLGLPPSGPPQPPAGLPPAKPETR